jgi:hypothetical protein
MALASRGRDDARAATADPNRVGVDGTENLQTRFVAEEVDSTTGRPPSKPTNRFDKSHVISRLDSLKVLASDWNGYGARPIDVDLVEQAKSLVQRLPGDLVDSPAVVPMTRGRFQFEWHRGNRSLELEFESQGRIHYLKADDDLGIEEEDILLTDQTAEIEELLRWFASE